MRKAQMLGQIVVFVIGLIVVGGVVLFGYQILQNLDDDRCEVARVTFATQLSTFLDRNRGWGTNKLVTLDAPCQTLEVCFIDRRIKDAAANGEDVTVQWVRRPGFSGAVDVIEAAAPSLDPTNVFTIQEGGVALPVERFSSTSAPVHISSPGSTEPRASCVPVEGGVLELRMEGTGSVVRVSDG